MKINLLVFDKKTFSNCLCFIWLNVKIESFSEFYAKNVTKYSEALKMLKKSFGNDNILQLRIFELYKRQKKHVKSGQIWKFFELFSSSTME